mmetsp:Transcript_25529/g.82262  ORF Transcript_25529/g.82262 Transcript_25529/m.82262 type:complete len:156 (-) Transcript_25529:1066-1533(-)
MARRLMRELSAAHRNADSDVFLVADEHDLYNWQAWIRGPRDTPFEGGVFELRIVCPKEYPMAPPSMTFRTRVFHPNVHFKTGEICVDFLKQSWTPTWDLLSACRAVASLLGEPEPDSPLNCDAGNLLRHGDKLGYASMARMYTVEHASQAWPGSR